MQTSERNGNAIGAVLVQEHDEVMLITNGGTLVVVPWVRALVAEVFAIG